jgi:hypothetical protein
MGVGVPDVGLEGVAGTSEAGVEFRHVDRIQASKLELLNSLWNKTLS